MHNQQSRYTPDALERGFSSTTPSRSSKHCLDMSNATMCTPLIKCQGEEDGDKGG